ncbi:MAG TPA: ATP-binding cassette domain-containing protein, partial [Dehalococcoidia bacterium]
LSLRVHDRELLVLVGPSGCGKSTTLRMIAGLEEVSGGTIRIGERVVTDLPPRERDIAMVFQSYALYPHMTVRENLAFGLRMRSGQGWLKKARCWLLDRPRFREGREQDRQIEAKVRSAAELLGLGDVLGRKPGQLSGGQRQRVAVGRAIVRHPQAFLFDEPLSNLDAKLRVQTRTELSKLHQRLGTTFIYVTHDQVEAMTMATRIAVLKDGLLHQVGTPEELYFQPDNLFVAGFIGSPAMNFVPGTLRGTAEEMTLDAASLQIRLPPERSKRLFPHAGLDVTIGIRPEDIHSAGFMPAHVRGFPVRARVDVTEMLGNETLLHLVVDTHRLLARVDPRTRARAGQEIEVWLDVDRLHIFDAKTEAAVDKIDLPDEIRESASARLAVSQEAVSEAT